MMDHQPQTSQNYQMMNSPLEFGLSMQLMRRVLLLRVDSKIRNI